jgi:alkylation response protein AidB-like acyl-CoA dehydrogenase
MAIAKNVVTAEELVARATDLVPILAEQAADCERNRRVSDEVMEAMRNADLFRLVQPTRFGGLELGFDVVLDVGRQLGRGCGSTGWVFGVLSDHQWIASLLPEQAQIDVWGEDQVTVISGSYAPTGALEVVDGGYRLSGKWGFASGCDHVGWHLAGVMLPAADADVPPSPGLALVPREDFGIEDDWFNVGLAGTGSKDVVVEDVFVPAYRTMTYASLAEGGAKVHAAPIYQLPFATVVPIGILAATLGMTRSALDNFIEVTRDRVSIGGATRGSSKAAESVTVQGSVAAAAAWLDAADSLVREDLAVAQTAALAGQSVSIDHRLRCRRDYSLAVDLCVQAVNSLFASSGARGTHLRNPVQRAWRDVNVAARHVGLSWDINRLPFGRVALGLEPQGQY